MRHKKLKEDVKNITFDNYTIIKTSYDENKGFVLELNSKAYYYQSKENRDLDSFELQLLTYRKN